MKISIITVCFNSAETIGDTLRSVAGQTHHDVEHVIIDGGSRDATMEIVRRDGGHVAKAISEPDRGIYDALNKGISRSTGDIVGFLHADDMYADQDVLARIAQAFQDPAVQAVYGDLQYVLKQDTNRVVRHWRAGTFDKARLRRGWMPPHPTLYVRREWYDRIGGFDTRYRIAADYDSILRLFSTNGFNAVYLPSVLVKMRVGGASNRSLSNIIRKSREDYAALRSAEIGGMRTLLWKNFSKAGQFLG